MTLSAAGRLLIGKTNDEGYTLDVVGTGRISGNSNGTFVAAYLVNSSSGTSARNILQFGNNVGNNGLIELFGGGYSGSGGGDDVADGFRILSGGSGGLALRSSAGSLRFYTGSSERLTIASTGTATFSCSVTSNGAKPQLYVNGDSGHGAGIHLNTSLSGVNRRNWAIFTEENVDGDFVIKSSTCTGGSPNSGNTRFAILNNGNVGIGCISPGVSLTIGGTDAIKVPVGTTAQRPSPSTGMVRFNSSCTELEYYNGSEWLFFTSTPTTQGYYADVLVVGGGGGGGGAEASNGFGGGGAGGGAGGFMAGRIFINYALQSYSIFIGGGGTGGSNESQGTGSGCNGTTGTASCALGLVAIGGGFGGGDETGTGGGNGGSGGGTGGDNSGTFGKSVLGQGCNGGDKNSRNGGGGGGASQNGFTGYTESGNGGNGRTWLNGTTYAGGGGGGAGAAVQSTSSGGSGGGGNGSSTNGTSEAFAAGGTATAGCDNTGGGGGAGAAGRAQGGQNGGSGIVIIRYFGSQKGFGGSITSSGEYTYHTFTTSGTYCATYYA
jgi:hypothetical protein